MLHSHASHWPTGPLAHWPTGSQAHLCSLAAGMLQCQHKGAGAQGQAVSLLKHPAPVCRNQLCLCVRPGGGGQEVRRRRVSNNTQQQHFKGTEQRKAECWILRGKLGTQAGHPIHRQAGRQAGGQAGGQAGRQAARQAGPCLGCCAGCGKPCSCFHRRRPLWQAPPPLHQQQPQPQRQRHRQRNKRRRKHRAGIDISMSKWGDRKSVV